MPNIDLEKASREDARWRILYTLDRGRPEPVAEHLILRCLSDIKLDFTPSGLRRELGYLESRELITITGREEVGDYWLASLTRVGVDMVEYTVSCEPGIARPVRR